jgi:hypothetical protein
MQNGLVGHVHSSVPHSAFAKTEDKQILADKTGFGEVEIDKQFM